MRIGGC